MLGSCSGKKLTKVKDRTLPLAIAILAVTLEDGVPHGAGLLITGSPQSSTIAMAVVSA